ncbi:MAG: zf-HC2 domain-containing protein [Bacillota bacterium]|nr:zf-HC2 domain-containing protein [Bacillota bacterium]
MKKMMDENTITCEEVIKKLPDFIGGKLEGSEAEEIENHIKDCDSCFSQMEINLPKSKGDDFEKKRRKFENVFIRRALGRVTICCLLITVVAYILFTCLYQTVFSKTLMKKHEQIENGLYDLVQFTMPGARITGGNEGSIGLFESINIVNFEQQLLWDNYCTGKIDVAVPNYIGENDWRYQFLYKKSGQKIGWNNPIQKNNEKLEKARKKLEDIKAWSKCAMVISFEKPVTLTEMDSIVSLSGDVSREWWFSIDTSNLSLNKWGYRKMNSFPSANWGFPMDIKMSETGPEAAGVDENNNPSFDVKEDEQGNLPQLWAIDTKRPVTQMYKYFRNEMGKFVGYAKYFEVDEFSKDLDNVYNLIKNKDVRINGAIFRATTSSALKVLNNSNIADVEIIKLDFDYNSPLAGY